jgi:hypothetical protein
MSLASNQDAWVDRDLEWPGLREASAGEADGERMKQTHRPVIVTGLRFQVDF